MSSPDLRDWLRQVDELGQLKIIEGADWNLEIGALTEMFCLQSESRPCLLFDRIKDCQPGWRLVTNSLATLERSAMVLNMPLGVPYAQVEQEWRRRVKGLRPLPAHTLTEGPVLENVAHGDDINLTRFPAAIWHEGDGGRYLGTASMVVTRDPDSGQVNVGTYRMMIQDRDKVGLYIAPGQHGRLHRDKYHERGERMPVVAVFGAHPQLFVAASLPLPLGLNEYEWAGAVRGEPVEVISGPVTGLPIPADAEIAIEGYVEPGKVLSEGPFGEYTGYYASAVRDETYIQVEALYHRNQPIVLGSSPMRPPGEYYYVQNTIRQAVILDALEAAGVPDVKAVAHLPGSCLGVLVVSIKQRYAGHAKQAAMVAGHTRQAGQFCRYVVVVDEDIDVHNEDEVLWAIWTRSDPARSADVVRDCWSQPLDPRLTPEQRETRDYTHSRMIIDATRPFHWRDRFPKVVGTSPELKEKVRDRWGALFGG